MNTIDQTLHISGLLMKTNGNGVPVPTNDYASAQLHQVRRLGKITWYGSQACVRYLVEVRDGRTIQIRSSDQCQEIQAWLKHSGRKIHAPQASRSIGYGISWGLERVSVERLVWEYMHDALGGEGWTDWSEQEIATAMHGWVDVNTDPLAQYQELLDSGFDPRHCRKSVGDSEVG